VPAGVVDGLEAVEVQVAHDVRLLPGARRVDRLAEATLEFVSVHQPGQGVVARLVGHLPRQPAQVGDVVQHHRRTGHLAARQLERRGRKFDAVLLAGGERQHHRAPAERDLRAGGNALLYRIGQRAPVLVVHERHQFAERLAECLRGRCPAELLGEAVHVLDTAVGVRRDQPLTERIQRQLGTRILARRGLGTGRDRQHLGRREQHPALGAHDDGGGAQLQARHLPERVGQLDLGERGCGFAGQAARQVGLDQRRVIR
jgi:hypothetical protein